MPPTRAVQGEWGLLGTVRNLLRIYQHGSTMN
jgi:hypothetical protein